MGPTTFHGWPVEATALLADIAADNRADRWPELREGHATLVRGPTLALAAELEAEFGPARVLRAHATRRFRPDAPPLRTDTGAVATSPGGCGLAVVLSPDALTVTVGHWRFDRDQRSRYRAAVDDVAVGEELAGLLRRLAADGLPADPEGELLILPRGWSPDHPRVWLARRRGLQVVRRWALGPWLATPDEISDVQNLAMSLDVNGERKQTGSTSTMIFSIPFLLAYITLFMVLEPGDVVTTGTPPGVGSAKKPPEYLKAGDELVLRVEGLGEQRSKVVPFKL